MSRASRWNIWLLPPYTPPDPRDCGEDSGRRLATQRFLQARRQPVYDDDRAWSDIEEAVGLGCDGAMIRWAWANVYGGAPPSGDVEGVPQGDDTEGAG